MKSTLLRLAALLALGAGLLGVTAKATPISFDYSNTTGSTINFDGNSHFSFKAGSSGYSFGITSGDAVGLTGNILGTFTIGNASAFTAPVTGTGTFSIFDGTTSLTADVSWLSLAQIGTGGTLNFNGALNLKNIAYSGNNSVLLDLKSAEAGNNTVTFQFASPTSIAQLKSTKMSTSFSGSVTAAPDGGTTLLLMGLGLSGLALVRRKRKVAAA